MYNKLDPLTILLTGSLNLIRKRVKGAGNVIIAPCFLSGIRLCENMRSGAMGVPLQPHRESQKDC